MQVEGVTNMLWWWGYKHVNGSLQVKRYFDPLDLKEAHQSPFVDIVAGPWECNGRDEALSKLETELKYNMSDSFKE